MFNLIEYIKMFFINQIRFHLRKKQHNTGLKNNTSIQDAMQLKHRVPHACNSELDLWEVQCYKPLKSRDSTSSRLNTLCQLYEIYWQFSLCTQYEMIYQQW